jgi:hypothetical protein
VRGMLFMKRLVISVDGVFLYLLLSIVHLFVFVALCISDYCRYSHDKTFTDIDHN